ncbi:hypothetical protein IMCC21906_02868 [Spongiibacter sp. IMCC21906]|jgi:ubiquinone biosynthesis protein UbiJ|uniref:ubiquinone biosynthesis accessory factor UbiJ n=1 Tax=Spongiibacter sp. IMCC21906 TaxID=1620392 RepID=UPI00062DDC7A|nr:SCP2 sterol-binding domain-containing protein [Spongiibacter sp. IMCC21906]AKH70511.1 hypothetical protein IMCC21906_02868 [Spongiibacter sp. IMCC21906]
MSSLENLVNRALNLDPATANKLSALEGNRFALSLKEPNLDLVLGIAGQRVQILHGEAEDATSRLSGRWQEFAAIATAEDPGAALINGDVTLTGDTGALLEFRKILAELDLDWERPLADAFGDVAGHQMARGIRSGRSWLASSSHKLNRQLEEFVREESQLIPHPVETQQYFDDIDAVRSHSERLEAKIRRLQQRANALKNQ